MESRFPITSPSHVLFRLGQGFNSFLQEPRFNKAVSFGGEIIQDNCKPGSWIVPQVASYSSRFVDKISDVVRSMNISAASVIKHGTIEVPRCFPNIDESKFVSADLNVFVSVKVINRTTTIIKSTQFTPRQLDVWTSDVVHDIYGDCFVSGFVEGGELHGIVSVKVLDASKKRLVETR
jgi:hypothetical protein